MLLVSGNAQYRQMLYNFKHSPSFLGSGVAITGDTFGDLQDTFDILLGSREHLYEHFRKNPFNRQLFSMSLFPSTDNSLLQKI